MRAQDFQNWMDITGCLTASEVAFKLGIHRNSAQKIVSDIKLGEDVEIKRTVALAMAALAQGLEPWKVDSDTLEMSENITNEQLLEAFLKLKSSTSSLRAEFELVSTVLTDMVSMLKGRTL